MNPLLALSVVSILFFAKIQSCSSASVNAVHVCAYSSDTTQYSPKCYDCIQEVYSNALLACLEATSMPKNISFKAANCMEGNCKIEYFTPTTPEVENVPPMWEFFSRLFMASNAGSSSFASASSRAKRSVKDNSVDIKDTLVGPIKFNIVKQVNTLVGRQEEDSPELEYAEM